jgi:hypothetical protein
MNGKIGKILSRLDLHMNLNYSCGIDAFLTKCCHVMVQALHLLSLTLTLSARHTEMACVRRLDMLLFIKCFLQS